MSSTFEDLKMQRSAVIEAVAALEATAVAMEFYGAADQAALDKCVADVKKCNVYVGIVGWRYGYVPEGSKLSITESEFEAAVEAGIPKLVYLASPASRPPHLAADDPVLRFRERVSKAVVRCEFKSDTSLATHVTADLSVELARLMARKAEESPLTYLCDRDPQTVAITLDISSPEGTGPPVFLVHGTRSQRPLKFLDSLRNFHLPECMGWGDDPAHEIDLTWPEGVRVGDVARSLRLSLAKSLELDVRKEPATLEARVQRKMAEQPGPVLVTCQAPELIGEDMKRLRAIVDYFKGWPRSDGSKPDLVVISVVHPASKAGSSDGREQRSRDAVADFEREETGLRVLPELSNIRLPDAAKWTRLKQVRSLTLRFDLEGEVQKLFDGDETRSLPMEDLAPKLNQLLEAARRPRP